MQELDEQTKKDIRSIVKMNKLGNILDRIVGISIWSITIAAVVVLMILGIWFISKIEFLLAVIFIIMAVTIAPLVPTLLIAHVALIVMSFRAARIIKRLDEQGESESQNEYYNHISSLYKR